MVWAGGVLEMHLSTHVHIGRLEAIEVLLLTIGPLLHVHLTRSCPPDGFAMCTAPCEHVLQQQARPQIKSSPAQPEVPCVELQTRLMPVTEAR